MMPKLMKHSNRYQLRKTMNFCILHEQPIKLKNNSFEVTKVHDHKKEQYVAVENAINLFNSGSGDVVTISPTYETNK